MSARKVPKGRCIKVKTRWGKASRGSGQATATVSTARVLVIQLQTAAADDSDSDVQYMGEEEAITQSMASVFLK